MYLNNINNSYNLATGLMIFNYEFISRGNLSENMILIMQFIKPVFLFFRNSPAIQMINILKSEV